MPKPIVVIYIPRYLVFSHGSSEMTPSDLMNILNGGDDRKYIRTEYWMEYYWFVFWKDGIDAPEFEVFYEKDFSDIKFNELKELINNSLKEIAEHE